VLWSQYCAIFHNIYEVILNFYTRNCLSMDELLSTWPNKQNLGPIFIVMTHALPGISKSEIVDRMQMLEDLSISIWVLLESTLCIST